MSHLRVSGVSKGFGPILALAGVSLYAGPGECLALTGANGAGKSTLLQIISGAMRPDEGSVEVDEHDLSTHGGWAKFRASVRIGYMGPHCMLYSDLTVRENLMLVARLARRANAAAELAELCGQLDLMDHYGKQVRECSQGILRRAGAARALLNDPQLLLLDEPFANLDADGRERLLALFLERKRRGCTLVVATHEPQFIAGLTDRVIALERGRITVES